ncbi:MAG: hypothetical protein JWP87_5213 [Labilithrix sp.]|nr:hypothetical protein [Labilithrix sp.]
MTRNADSLSMPALGVLLVLVAPSCKPKDTTGDGTETRTAPVVSAREVVPPAAPFNATPVAQYADAGNLDGQPPFEQATVYEANGQLWMARLVLERKALGSDATKDETELLAKICMQQNDLACVEACSTKLGRKIKLDGGAAPRASASAVAGQQHTEPDTDLARVRDLVLKMQYDPARKSLEPKVLDGKASREEIRMLKTICEKQGDRMCVALCESKLK